MRVEAKLSNEELRLIELLRTKYVDGITADVHNGRGILRIFLEDLTEILFVADEFTGDVVITTPKEFFDD